MARELHDTLSQGLTGIILQLEAVNAHLTNNNTEKAQTIVSNAMEQARATLADARNAIDDLRSTAAMTSIPPCALKPTISPTPLIFPAAAISVRCPKLPENVTEAMVRSVDRSPDQHRPACPGTAGNRTVTVDETSLTVTVEDDGQGFDPQAIPSGHYGLLGIRERMRLINGKCTLESEKGKGTKFTMEVPL